MLPKFQPETAAAATNLARDCWFLTGATASGKTGVGLHLAQLLDAEIISLDSMSVYRGMDIGTDKPSAEARQKIPHHLLDLIPPTEDFSVAQYLEATQDAIRGIRGRGREVLFVGGTPLYLKALLRGIFVGPAADWEFRQRVAEEASQRGAATLHERLRQVDPLSAARLHPHDMRRIIRALEVQRATGRPISHEQLHFDEGLSAEQCKVFVLQWPRLELHQRINQRVQRMFDVGMVGEVRKLLEAYGSLGRTASQAVGYRQVIEHLHGEHMLPETIQRVCAKTRQFARRQETWFRSLRECTIIAMEGEMNDAKIARKIVEMP